MTPSSVIRPTGPLTLRTSILPKTYPDNKWAPKGYEGLTGVGYFPVDEHMQGEGNLVLTMAGWGALLMNVASKNMDNLSLMFVLGVDMHKFPGKYAVGSPTLPKKLEDVKVDAAEMLTYHQNLKAITDGSSVGERRTRSLSPGSSKKKPRLN